MTFYRDYLTAEQNAEIGVYIAAEIDKATRKFREDYLNAVRKATADLYDLYKIEADRTLEAELAELRDYDG